MDVLVFGMIVAVRGIVPLFIFRWPFWGAIACIPADAFDSVIQDALGVHPLEGHYHNVDKVFDLYYLGIEAIVASRWEDTLARSTALVLFGLRLLAVVLFEITGSRGLFLIGPNIFENFYLFIAGMQSIDARYRVASPVHLAVIVLFVGIPKVVQEYVMHYREAQTWDFVKENILQWR
jgi:hypothetical protein